MNSGLSATESAAEQSWHAPARVGSELRSTSRYLNLLSRGRMLYRENDSASEIWLESHSAKKQL